jgi:hypothetical protein
MIPEERRARRSLKRARLQSDAFTVGDTTAYVEAWVRSAVEAETERCVRKIAAFTKLSGSRKTALIAEICGEAIR